MEQFVAIFNLLIGIGVIAMQVAIVVILGALVIRNTAVLHFIARKKISLLAVISGIALAGSVTYSYVIGFTACYLCWIQRILLLPVFFAALVGSIKRSPVRRVLAWLLPFTIAGTIVAIYHTLIQNGVGTGSALCQAVGGTSCTQLYVNEFGYITIPVMSLTVFVLILLIALIRKPRN